MHSIRSQTTFLLRNYTFWNRKRTENSTPPVTRVTRKSTTLVRSAESPISLRCCAMGLSSAAFTAPQMACTLGSSEACQTHLCSYARLLDEFSGRMTTETLCHRVRVHDVSHAPLPLVYLVCRSLVLHSVALATHQGGDLKGTNYVPTLGNKKFEKQHRLLMVQGTHSLLFLFQENATLSSIEEHS